MHGMINIKFVITYFMCVSCMHKSYMSGIRIRFIKKERTTYIYKQQEESLGKTIIQETLKLWLLIPVFFGTSDSHLPTRPVNKLVMATAYSNITARSHS
jgi:hypothetical protein